MKGDLLLEHLLNFRLPGFKVNLSHLQCPIQAHAQRQAMLVVVGQGDKVLVAKHVAIVDASPGLRNPSPVTPVTYQLGYLARIFW
jgi:hypothetical protein